MRLMSLKQYMKMSKPALIRKIMKTLRAMPKKKLAVLCYNITKSKLPRLKTIKQLPYRQKMRRKQLAAQRLFATSEGEIGQSIRRMKKRKFSRKQLAAQRLFAKRARAGTLRRR